MNLKTGKKPPVHRSTYDLGYRFADTVRYGFVTPFYKYEGISGDKVSLRSGHNLRTLSLKSPLFQNLRMNKDFYAVPMKALLPLNWDKLFNNPVQGDDVDPAMVNTLFANDYQGGKSFMKEYAAALKQMAPQTSHVTTEDTKFLMELIRTLLTMEPFCSKGNLFAHYKIDPWHGLRYQFTFSPLEVYNAYFSAFHAWFDKYFQLADSTVSKKIPVDFKDLEGNIIATQYYDFTVMKERIRFYYDALENPYFVFNLASSDLIKKADCNQAAYTVLTQAFKGQTDLAVIFDNWYKSLDTAAKTKTTYVNVAPVLAYQMVMYEYFTNDKVDFCYNSDMWRQTIFTYACMQNLRGQAISGMSTFVWNDKTYQYDAFSRVGLYNIVSSWTNSLGDAKSALYVSLINDLFGIKRNLKYIDYFTGARMRPIAVGDLNVQVNNNSVDVINISRNIQMQRFLNQLNRVGPDAKNYLKGIFDVEERQHIDVPVKIGHIDETVYGEEVQNTADAQQTEPNSITTNLKSRGSNYAFEFKITENTIILGLVSFSIRRFYNNGIDPFSKKVDRFDMFNPYLQFVGDQPIPLEQISSQNSEDLIFGYTGRYAEYKNALDYACGDFKDGALKTWIFSDETPEAQSAANPSKLSSEFIRQNPTELDDFYLNMTGKTPDERYHFIVVFDNMCTASRNMVFNPQILG